MCRVSPGTVILGLGKFQMSVRTLSATPTFLPIWTSTRSSAERTTRHQLETAAANVTALPGTGLPRCKPACTDTAG